MSQSDEHWSRRWHSLQRVVASNAARLIAAPTVQGNTWRVRHDDAREDNWLARAHRLDAARAPLIF